MAKYIQIGAYDTPSVSKTSGATASLPKVAGFVLERYRQAGDLVSLQRSKRTPKDLGIPAFSMQAASAGSGRSSLSGIDVGKFSDAGLFGTKPLISQDAATSLVDKFVNRPESVFNQNVALGTQSGAGAGAGAIGGFNVTTPITVSANPQAIFT